MNELILYGFAPSTYTRTARMVCVELGVAHTLEPLDFKAPSHLALHPFGKMPVLQHGDLTLYETLAIAVYLDDRFGKSRLQPKTAAERARMFQWISAAIDYVYPAVVGGVTHGEPPGEEALAAAGDTLAVLDAALRDTPYLAGAGLSLADLFVLPMLDYAVAAAGASLLEDCPHLARWRTTLAARVSAQETAA